MKLLVRRKMKAGGEYTLQSNLYTHKNKVILEVSTHFARHFLTFQHGFSKPVEEFCCLYFSCNAVHMEINWNFEKFTSSWKRFCNWENLNVFFYECNLFTNSVQVHNGIEKFNNNFGEFDSWLYFVLSVSKEWMIKVTKNKIHPVGMVFRNGIILLTFYNKCINMI